MKRRRKVPDPARIHSFPARTLLVALLGVCALFTAAPRTARADEIAEGRRALKEGRVEEAIAHYQRAVQAEPNRAEAQLGLGQALERRRRWEDALKTYDAAAKLDPRSAEAQRGRGATLAKLGRLEEAAKAYEEANKLDRRFPQAQLGLGETLVQLGRYDQAVAVYEEGVKWGVKTRPLFYEGLGRAEAARGRLKEAEVYLLKAREEAPTMARFHRALGDLYMQRKIPSLAVVSYTQAIDLDKDDLDSRFAMARALGRDGRYNEALDQYKEITKRDSTYEEAYKEMGDIYLRASETNPGFINDALVNLQTYSRLAPNDPDGAALLARAHYKLGHREEARKLLEPVAQAGKLTPEGHLMNGRLVYENKQWAEAVKEFSLAGAKLEDLDVQRYAHSLRMIGRPEAADTLFVTRWVADSLANKPLEKSSNWVLERGKLRYSQGAKDTTKYVEAIPFFQRKIDLDPKSYEAYYYMGLSLRELGRLPESLEALKKASEIAPDKADPRFWQAVVLLKTPGQDAEARKIFEDVARLDSTTTIGAIARQRVGYYVLVEKRYPEAIDLLLASIKIDPKQAQTWVWLGQAYQNTGQRAKAIEAYRKALEIDPNQPDARKGLQQLQSP